MKPRAWLLLSILVGLAVFYYWQSQWQLPFGLLAREASTAAPPAKTALKVPPSVAVALNLENPSSAWLALFKAGEYAQLDQKFGAVVSQGTSAGHDQYDAVVSLAYLDEESLKKIGSWAQEKNSAYAYVVLSYAWKHRAFLARGGAYLAKTDPARMQRFRQLSQTAVDHARAAVQLLPKCAQCHDALLDAMLGVATRAQIEAAYQQARTHVPDDSGPVLSYAYAIEGKWQGAPGEGAAFTDAFVKAHPQHAASNRLLSERLADAGQDAHTANRHGEAIMLLDKALDLNPRHARALAVKGEAMEYVQVTQDPLVFLNRALEIDPYADRALMIRGLLRLRRGDAGGQNDLVRAALLGDVYALQKALYNWLSGKEAAVPMDASKIVPVCNAIVGAGVPEGWFCLGTSLYFGYGIAADPARGFEYMRQAADLGVADAMSDVGKLYWIGAPHAGIAPDKEKAIAYLYRAASIQNDRALVELSQIRNDPVAQQILKRYVASDGSPGTVAH